VAAAVAARRAVEVTKGEVHQNVAKSNTIVSLSKSLSGRWLSGSIAMIKRATSYNNRGRLGHERMSSLSRSKSSSVQKQKQSHERAFNTAATSRGETVETNEVLRARSVARSLEKKAQQTSALNSGSNEEFSVACATAFKVAAAAVIAAVSASTFATNVAFWISDLALEQLESAAKLQASSLEANAVSEAPPDLQVADLQEHFYWIDIFSVPHEPPPFFVDVAEAVKSAISSCSVCVVCMHPYNEPIALHRLWCLWEIQQVLRIQSERREKAREWRAKQQDLWLTGKCVKRKRRAWLATSGTWCLRPKSGIHASARRYRYPYVDLSLDNPLTDPCFQPAHNRKSVSIQSPGAETQSPEQMIVRGCPRLVLQLPMEEEQNIVASLQNDERLPCGFEEIIGGSLIDVATTNSGDIPASAGIAGFKVRRAKVYHSDEKSSLLEQIDHILPQDVDALAVGDLAAENVSVAARLSYGGGISVLEAQIQHTVIRWLRSLISKRLRTILHAMYTHATANCGWKDSPAIDILNKGGISLPDKPIHGANTGELLWISAVKLLRAKGRLLEVQGRYGEAQWHLTRAHMDASKLLGEEHPLAVSCLLDATQSQLHNYARNRTCSHERIESPKPAPRLAGFSYLHGWVNHSPSRSPRRPIQSSPLQSTHTFLDLIRLLRAQCVRTAKDKGRKDLQYFQCCYQFAYACIHYGQYQPKDAQAVQNDTLGKLVYGSPLTAGRAVLSPSATNSPLLVKEEVEAEVLLRELIEPSFSPPPRPRQRRSSQEVCDHDSGEDNTKNDLPNTSNRRHSMDQSGKRPCKVRNILKAAQESERLKAAQLLVSLLLRQGRLVSAETLARQMAHRAKAMCGETSIETLYSLNNLAMALHRHRESKKDGKDLLSAEVLSISKYVLEGALKVLGPRHPHTLMMQNNLGQLLVAQAQVHAAIVHFRSALDGRKATLGWLHPATLTSASNLGVALLEQGQIGEAGSLLQDVVAACVLCFGEGHPFTQKSKQLQQLQESLSLTMT